MIVYIDSFIYNLKSLYMHNTALCNSQEQETIQSPSIIEWIHKLKRSRAMEFCTAKSIPMINRHTQQHG